VTEQKCRQWQEMKPLDRGFAFTSDICHAYDTVRPDLEKPWLVWNITLCGYHCEVWSSASPDQFAGESFVFPCPRCEKKMKDCLDSRV
jgi:hypothetical protein